MNSPNNLLRRLTLLTVAIIAPFGVRAVADPAETHVVHNFSVIEGRPDSNLILGPDGLFYGTIEDGGPDGNGIVYQVAPDGTTSTFFAFNSTTGIFPVADSLVVGADGNFYGITGSGGPAPADHGTFFRLSPTGVLTTLHGFTDADGANSAFLDFEGPLTLGDDGNFWGISPLSSYHSGAIFYITPTGTPTIAYQFDSVDGSTTEGSLRVARLIKGPGQAFYGVLGDRVFRAPIQGAFSILHHFDPSVDPESGIPSSGIVFDQSGEILGATSTGAIYTIQLVNAPFYTGMYSAVQNVIPDGTCYSQLATDAAGLVYGSVTASDSDYVFVYYPAATTFVGSPIIFVEGGPNGTYQGEALTGFTAGADGQFYGITNDEAGGSRGAVYAFAPYNDAPATPNLVKLGGAHGFAESASASGQVTFKRSGDLSLPLTVKYKPAGLANDGTYFQALTKSITFPANVNKVKLQILPTGAAISDNLTLTIKLKSSGSAYTLGSTSKVNVTITP